MNQSPAHREAFESLRSKWQQLDVVQRLRTEKVDTDIISRWSRRRHLRRRILPLATAAAVVCAMVALWILRAPSTYEAEYFTSIGEQQVIALPDDSHITLNTNTRIEVRYTPGERRIRLLQGEALFEVAPAPSRPFIVAAGDGILRAVGTAFTVKLQADEVEVTVTEGTVEVVPLAVPADVTPASTAPEQVRGPARRVTERQRLRYRNDGVEMMSTVTTAQIKRELAWRDGMLDFESTPLSEVIAEA
ncbi:MAG TPA: FecR domain-containing protein, partial [Woeseiaceae bacterium]|nr:FecR domain-containing protein [Woeseiaceae bacterium]